MTNEENSHHTELHFVRCYAAAPRITPSTKSVLKRSYAAPVADAEPVVHGRWISDGDGYHWTYNCSICAWKDGYPFNERHNFWPHCGAKMDLEESTDA